VRHQPTSEQTGRLKRKQKHTHMTVVARTGAALCAASQPAGVKVTLLGLTLRKKETRMDC